MGTELETSYHIGGMFFGCFIDDDDAESDGSQDGEIADRV